VSGLFGCMFLVGAAFSSDEIVIGAPADIVPLLPPPGASSWDPAAVVEAIRVSRAAFSPADVYDLVDRRAPERVIRAVSERAGEPFDHTWRPLDEIAADARRGQPESTVTVDVETMAQLFTTLQRLEAEVDHAQRSIAPLAPRGAGETERLYERRARRHAIEQVRAVGPAHGRIEATSFVVELPVVEASSDGCRRPVAIADMSDLPFSTFRAGMGALERSNPVNMTSSTIERALFTVEGGFRLEVVGRCGEVARSARFTLRRTHDGRWSGRGDIH